MVNLIVVNLKNPDEVTKLASLQGPNGKAAIEKTIAEGRTSVIFDLSTGDIVMVVQNGELLHSNNENVTFKSIL